MSHSKVFLNLERDETVPYSFHESSVILTIKGINNTVGGAQTSQNQMIFLQEVRLDT